MARNLAILDNTCILALINCVKSQESITAVINALKALNLVLRDADDNLISLCSRNRIVPVIKGCLQKQSPELRMTAVILCNRLL